MSLTVLVKSASNLPNVERFSKSDPMTVCILQGACVVFSLHWRSVCVFNIILFLRNAGQKKKTKVIDNNLDPVWDEVSWWLSKVHAGVQR